jgi:hypothetical protein
MSTISAVLATVVEQLRSRGTLSDDLTAAVCALASICDLPGAPDIRHLRLDSGAFETPDELGGTASLASLLKQEQDGSHKISVAWTAAVEARITELAANLDLNTLLSLQVLLGDVGADFISFPFARRALSFVTAMSSSKTGTPPLPPTETDTLQAPPLPLEPAAATITTTDTTAASVDNDADDDDKVSGAQDAPIDAVPPLPTP